MYAASKIGIQKLPNSPVTRPRLVTPIPMHQNVTMLASVYWEAYVSIFILLGSIRSPRGAVRRSFMASAGCFAFAFIMALIDLLCDTCILYWLMAV
jgi:hypothetical protein